MPVVPTEGDYSVALDLDDEGITWFQQGGSPVVTFSMQVTADQPTKTEPLSLNAGTTR
jgi:hypothetical protein